MKTGDNGNRPFSNDHYVKMFFVIAASVLFFFAVYRFELVMNAFSKIMSVLEPIIFGLVIAYLLNPLVDIFEKKVFARLFKKGMTDRQEKLVCFVSVFISIVIFCLIIAGIIILIIPGVVDSFAKLSSVLPPKITEYIQKGNEYLSKNELAQSFFDEATAYVQKWMKTDLTGVLYKSLDYIFFGFLGVVNFLTNFVIGLLISVYVLYNKRSFGNKSRKVMFAVFKEKTVGNILFVLKKSNSVFSGFIYGKILDSIIIGIICFIGVTVMGMPYNILVATVVGITNLIPVFGPYIGGIPCALMILLTDPLKGVYFIIFIVLLQLLDGNVIGPKILGGTTGIETFWVMFAIIVGGGLFGIPGMILGVPMFAVIYYFISLLTNKRLEKKNMPTSSEDYGLQAVSTGENGGSKNEEEQAD